MNIVFWSESDDVRYRDSFVAMGIMAGFLNNSRIVMIQDRFGTNPIDYSFNRIEDYSLLKEDYGYFNNRGMDQIISKGLNDVLSSELVWDNLVHVPDSKIFYMPGTRRSDSDYREYELVKANICMMNVLKQFIEPVFVAIKSGYGIASKNAIKSADLVVVCLSQCASLIDKRLLLEDLEIKNYMYLLNEYDENSKYNKKIISKMYNSGKKDFCIIPYNIRFREATYEGKAFEFIKYKLKVSKSDKDYDFISNVRSSTELLLKKLS